VLDFRGIVLGHAVGIEPTTGKNPIAARLILGGKFRHASAHPDIAISIHVVRLAIGVGYLVSRKLSGLRLAVAVFVQPHVTTAVGQNGIQALRPVRSLSAVIQIDERSGYGDFRVLFKPEDHYTTPIHIHAVEKTLAAYSPDKRRSARIIDTRIIGKAEGIERDAGDFPALAGGLRVIHRIVQAGMIKLCAVGRRIEVTHVQEGADRLIAHRGGGKALGEGRAIRAVEPTDIGSAFVLSGNAAAAHDDLAVIRETYTAHAPETLFTVTAGNRTSKYTAGYAKGGHKRRRAADGH